MAAMVAPAGTAIPEVEGLTNATAVLAADTDMDSVAATDAPPAATAVTKVTATDACRLYCSPSLRRAACFSGTR
jgi:hypothetical protein